MLWDPEKNVYEDFKLINDKFDWSNFKDHPDFEKYYDKTNKKVPGKFKFEEVSIIKEFVGSAPKDYSYMMDNGNETLKNKCVKKSATMKDGSNLRHKHKLKCLIEETLLKFNKLLYNLKSIK